MLSIWRRNPRSIASNRRQRSHRKCTFSPFFTVHGAEIIRTQVSNIDNYFCIRIRNISFCRFYPADAETLLAAFKTLDEENKGYITRSKITKLIMEEGEQFTQVILWYRQIVLWKFRFGFTFAGRIRWNDPNSDRSRYRHDTVWILYKSVDGTFGYNVNWILFVM